MVPMRMQWWRDAVNGIFKAKPIRHPAIQCLHQVGIVDCKSANASMHPVGHESWFSAVRMQSEASDPFRPGP